MARKDPYEMFPAYVELREALNTTPDGRDLLAILFKRKMPKGYELRSTDRFYIDLGSKTYIRKLSDGQWYYTALSDGKPFSQAYYSTIEEMIKDVWIKGVLKRTPDDVKREDLKNWLIKPDCPVIGKEMTADEITGTYLESLGDGYFIKSVDSLFTSPEWKEIFNFIGFQPIISNDGKLRPTYSLGKIMPFKKDFENFAFWSNFILQVSDNPEGAFRSWERSHLSFKIKTSPKIGKVSKRYFNSTLEIRVGGKTQEEVETLAMNEIVFMLKQTNFIIGKPFDENPILQLIVSLLSKKPDKESNWATQIAEFVLKNPTTLELIPESNRKRVMEAGNISEELAETIRYSKEMGILK